MGHCGFYTQVSPSSVPKMDISDYFYFTLGIMCPSLVRNAIFGYQPTNFTHIDPFQVIGYSELFEYFYLYHMTLCLGYSIVIALSVDFEKCCIFVSWTGLKSLLFNRSPSYKI